MVGILQWPSSMHDLTMSYGNKRDRTHKTVTRMERIQDPLSHCNTSIQSMTFPLSVTKSTNQLFFFSYLEVFSFFFLTLKAALLWCSVIAYCVLCLQSDPVKIFFPFSFILLLLTEIPGNLLSYFTVFSGPSVCIRFMWKGW